MTRAWSQTRCTRCGHEETRYSNVKCCRACGGALDLARRIVARAWLWAAHDTELRELLRKWEAS